MIRVVPAITHYPAVVFFTRGQVAQAIESLLSQDCYRVQVGIVIRPHSGDGRDLRQSAVSVWFEGRHGRARSASGP
jgi:hypothetical protein